MKSKLIIGLLILTLIAVPLFATACEEEVTPPGEEEEEGPPPGEEEEEGDWWDEFGEPQYGGEITLWVNSLRNNFDSANWMELVTYWFEPLFIPDWTLDREICDFKTTFVSEEYYVGGLAESWEWPDTQTMVIQIREGVYWQDKPPVNGREFTAYDVEYHFNRLMGTGSGFTEPNPMYGMFLGTFNKVTATDKYTVVVEFNSPAFWVNFRSILETIIQSMEAQEVVEQYEGINDERRAIGTGPFMLTDYDPGTSMTLEANPNYWGYDERYPENQLPYADSVKVMCIPDTSTALAALRSGQIDLINFLDWKQAQNLAESNPELQQAELPYQGWDLSMRVDKSPFTDIRVRKALQMALDRETIAETYYGGTVDGKPAGLISPAITGYCLPYDEWPAELQAEYSYDPDTAMALLAEAAADGVFEPNEYGGFDTVCQATTTDDLGLLQIIQSQFKDIGVYMDIETYDPVVSRSMISAGEHEQLVAGPGCGPVGAPSALISTHHSANPANASRSQDPIFDALSESMNVVSDPAEAQQLMIEADQRYLSQHYTVMTFPLVVFNVWQPYLKGYSGEGGIGGPMEMITPFWTVAFARCWIDQDLKESMGY
jgi:peptide/nickel transport system substrate-binding protein